MHKIIENKKQKALLIAVILISAVFLACTITSPLHIQEYQVTTTPTSPIVSVNSNATITLQVAWEGKYSLPNGAITALYGPDSVVIPLNKNGDNFSGNADTIWHTSASGQCTATGTVPITFDVTAKEKTGNIISFTVNRTLTWNWDTKCPGISGGSSSAKQSFSYVFDLAENNGAKKEFNQGGPTWTFTLIIR